jgi:raffinose/stachyose/melibiose transport system substrate-binding protein
MKRCLLLILIFSLAGAVGLFAKGATEQKRDEPSKPVEITCLVDNNTSLDAVVVVAEEFERQTGIKVIFESRPAGPEGVNLIKTRLATGEMTDFFLFNAGSLLVGINPERNCLDLSSEPYMERILDSFKQTVSVNGAIFGIPLGSSMAGGWLYNKKVYGELGLEVPTTWDDLMANCEAVKKAGKIGVIGTYKDVWSSQLILLSDFYYINNEVPDFAEKFTKNQAKFATTPKALGSFEKYADIQARNLMNKDYLAATYDDGLKMLCSGEGVHYPMLTDAFNAIGQNYPESINDIGFFAQPDNSKANGATIWMPSAFYVNKNSEYLDEVKQFFDFYLSEEGMKIYSQYNTAIGPYVISGVSMPEKTYPGVLDVLKYFDEAGRTSPALEFLSPVKAPSSGQICVEVGSGMATALEAAEKYDRDTEKQAKQLALSGW